LLFRHCTLTNHKKSVRALALHPKQYSFATAAPDNIKQWKFPDGKIKTCKKSDSEILGNFIQNVSGHNAILNALAINSDGVMVSGADNGTMQWFDWRTGYNFQRYQAPVQPGSLDSESGIFALAFDKSESRLISCEGDKVNEKVSFRTINLIQDYQTLQRRRGSHRRNKPDSLETGSRATKAILDQILFYCPFHNTFIQCVINRSYPYVPICISALEAQMALEGSYVIIL